MARRPKRHVQPVQLPKANLPGRKYEEDRPDDCRFCYFWRKTSKDCQLKGCFYLRPVPPKIEERFDADGNLILDCRICPYNRVSPCIGYCIASLRRDVVGSTRQRKEES